MATVFRSTSHPGNTPWGVVYGRYLARPLGVCTVPLMIGATMSALLGQPVWAYLVWGLPAAIGLATVWAHFSMDRTIAEVALRPGQAAFRSVYEVLREKERRWNALYDVRTTSWNTEISVGRVTHELYPNRWPQYVQLQETARQSLKAQTGNAV